MTSPTVSSRNFVLLSASVLTWVLVLSLTLKLLFGAGMSGGWVIVGTMFTLVVGGAILMVKEIQSAFSGTMHVPRPVRPHKSPTMMVRLQRPGAPPSAKTHRPAYKRVRHPRPPRREALGLSADFHFANRRRWSLVPRSGPTFQEKLRYWLICNNLTCLIRN